MKASLLIHREFVINDGKFAINIKVYEVVKSKKFPEGIKAKFILTNIQENSARLLVDNHQPYGFHMHTKLPHDRNHREILNVKSHEEALVFFLEEVERIIKNEEK